MKIKWNFNKNEEYLAKAIGSSEAFSRKCGKAITNEIENHYEDNESSSKSGFIEKIINVTNPQSPGDVMLVGLLIGGAFYVEKQANMLDQVVGRTIDFNKDAVDCYNKEQFKNNMYNNENDF